MLEQIVDKKNLKKEKPARMNIGDFWTFKEVSSLFGVGNQDVHNSGSSMIRDTPNFLNDILDFLNSHINYTAEDADYLGNCTVDEIFDKQKIVLEEFMSDPLKRKDYMNNLFLPNTLVFKENIPTKLFVTALILYIMKKYNFFRSKNKDHELTKMLIKKYFSSEEILLKKIQNVLYSDEPINYLTDVCFGRYYFLQVHFMYRNSKNEIRNVPEKIIEEFTKCLTYIVEEEGEEKDQRKIHMVHPYSVEELKIANKKPPIKSNSDPRSKRYNTDARKAKTVIKMSGYQCDYAKLLNISHNTFKDKDNNQYMEGHHLVPMKAQDDFLPISLDISDNIVCLCPICHAAVHKGNKEERERVLQVLYQSRIKKLKKQGIDISFDDLMKKYYK